MTQDASLALFFLSLQGPKALEESHAPYGKAEESEVRDLLSFVQETSGRYAAPVPSEVRITRTLRVYVGEQELKIRPMAKAVLLLFLRHPEGIVLKQIGDYRKEMANYYGRVMRSLDPDDVDRRIQRLLDIFSNELNVNISRVNAAISALVGPEEEKLYRVGGRAGNPKSIPLDRTLVIWE
jgi:hypothetical protein